ncbi:MAG: hypothetical protein JNK77_10560 [Saprospiraceae bacterium]|nr:hypothetical protein [Saprospiraceae bacterium]
MADLHFETNVAGNFSIQNGSFAIMTEGADTGGTFPAPGPFDPTETNRFIQTDQSSIVNLKWTVKGGLALLMSGTWRCKVVLEKMGGGEFAQDYKAATPFVAALSNDYAVKVNIPANEVEEGVYRLLAIITLEGPGGAKAPVVAFADLGLIQFYQAA